jgi:tetratricopeptide (TPR) repeat protein
MSKQTIIYGNLALITALWIALMIGCDKQIPPKPTASTDSKITDIRTAFLDKPLARYQTDLLDIAFDTATRIPVKPHIKNRSMTQEAVVTACLKLDQPQRAVRWIEKIENWRRGVCYADVASYYARQNQTEEAKRYLNLAMQVTQIRDLNSQEAQDFTQQWRKDVILVKIAQVYLMLGETEQAGRLEQGVVESETGKLAATRAIIDKEVSFDEQVKSLDAIIAQGNFDTSRNALNAYARLFERFYDDPSRRDQICKKITDASVKLPLMVRIELLLMLAGYALDHADNGNVLEYINQAQQHLDGNGWPPQNKIQLTAQLVELRFKAGDRQKALVDADVALAFFQKEKSKIVNIDRAGILRPLAQAYQSMGKTTTALAIYKQAVEEGIENPNSRPRAEDLSATCCSMALCGMEPDTQLWTRLRQVAEGLGNPW